MRTAFALAAGAFLAALPATVCAGTPDARVFATCAGRLSALTEFQWMMDGPASETTARERDAMVALVDAMGDLAPDLTPELALHWRITAKAAQSALLRKAAFGSDSGGVMARRADDLIAGCRALLLG